MLSVPLCSFNEKAVAGAYCLFKHASALYIHETQSFLSYRTPELTLFVTFYISMDSDYHKFF